MRESWFSAAGQPEQAKSELAVTKRLASADALRDMKILDLNSLTRIAQIAVAMLEGDIAEKSGRYPEAIASFQRAVDLEERLLYSEPPDWFISPRHYLGHAYVRAGQPAEAERVFRENLKRHRNNGGALRGMEQSLRMQGRDAEADDVSGRFEKAWKHTDIRLNSARF